MSSLLFDDLDWGTRFLAAFALMGGVLATTVVFAGAIFVVGGSVGLTLEF